MSSGRIYFFFRFSFHYLIVLKLLSLCLTISVEILHCTHESDILVFMMCKLGWLLWAVPVFL